MHEARPGPGEEINPGPVTTPRPAATIVLLRDGEEGLEVLLARRTPRARFMGGAWVFPGGGVHEADGPGEAGLRAAAMRELAEEAGIRLPDADQLVPYARWITPSAVRIRYDTWFFLALAPPGARPVVDGEEVVDARWLTPTGALAAARAGEIFLVFPTIKQLEQLAGFACAQALLDHARASTVLPVQPELVGSGETARIVLPGEAG
jgi:8-oxo-dGTP pyrophosphatase MutT (NUDIX family)